MSSNRTKNAALNIFFALVLQLVTFFRGLILPRIIIPTYGSDVNGLISSITQFLAYISLLEAGVGSIFRTSLYRPLAHGDMEEVSGIINEQKRFYKKIGLIFILYVIVLCMVYPMVAKTEKDPFYVITCILILSGSTFAEYFFSLPYISLLSADQRVRISYITSIIYTVINIFVALFWVSIKADIRLIYLSMCLIGMLRPLFYTLYVRKHYALQKKAACRKSALDQRWNGMVHHFAYYIHTNTDATILTLFISTTMVSVYNVYGAVVFGIEKIITSLSAGIAAGLGNLLETENRQRINQTVDVFEFVQGGATTVLYAITAVMLLPFVRLYTANMTDASYVQPAFGYFLVIAEAIYCFRCIYSTVSTNANQFKGTQPGAIMECAVNVIVSLLLVLVADMGITGVAIGTMLAMLSRYVFEVWFLSKNVLNRPVIKAGKMLALSIAVAVISFCLCNWLLDYSCIISVKMWIGYGMLSTLIVCAVAMVIYGIFYRDIVKWLCKTFIGRCLTRK